MCQLTTRQINNQKKQSNYAVPFMLLLSILLKFNTTFGCGCFTLSMPSLKLLFSSLFSSSLASLIVFSLSFTFVYQNILLFSQLWLLLLAIFFNSSNSPYLIHLTCIICSEGSLLWSCMVWYSRLKYHRKSAQWLANICIPIWKSNYRILLLILGYCSQKWYLAIFIQLCMLISSSCNLTFTWLS